MENSEKRENLKKINQEQVYELVFNRRIDWQDIIYDLINTEQLDPWDIDIILLTDKYLEKIKNLEETDFYISGKVLLAASLLLRLKSEFLVNKYLKSIDEILFGKKQEIKKPFEKIELDEEIPDLVLKTPLPRYRKITLKELIESLNKAINTENRRIKREIIRKNAIRESLISMPKIKISIKDRIKEAYLRIVEELDIKKAKKISFSELVKNKNEEKINFFAPLLHLDHQKKIWLEQEKHFEEIFIWLKSVYLKHNPNYLQEIISQIEKDTEKTKKIKEINKDFENPINDLIEKEL